MVVCYVSLSIWTCQNELLEYLPKLVCFCRNTSLSRCYTVKIPHWVPMGHRKFFFTVSILLPTTTKRHETYISPLPYIRLLPSFFVPHLPPCIHFPETFPVPIPTPQYLSTCALAPSCSASPSSPMHPLPA
jgi:hypothetical protein